MNDMKKELVRLADDTMTRKMNEINFHFGRVSDDLHEKIEKRESELVQAMGKEFTILGTTGAKFRSDNIEIVSDIDIDEWERLIDKLESRKQKEISNLVLMVATLKHNILFSDENSENVQWVMNQLINYKVDMAEHKPKTNKHQDKTIVIYDIHNKPIHIGDKFRFTMRGTTTSLIGEFVLVRDSGKYIIKIMVNTSDGVCFIDFYADGYKNMYNFELI
jgi:hypothetical protein